MKKRLKVLIYPKFQLGLLAANTALMATALFFVGIQMKRAFMKLQEMGASANIPADHAYFKFLNWQVTQMWSYVAIAFAGAFLFSAILTLVISNKLAGPVIRLRGYFNNIEKTGQVNAGISFRKGDFFSDLPATINGALKKLTQNKDHKNKAA